MAILLCQTTHLSCCHILPIELTKCLIHNIFAGWRGTCPSNHFDIKLIRRNIDTKSWRLLNLFLSYNSDWNNVNIQTVHINFVKFPIRPKNDVFTIRHPVKISEVALRAESLLMISLHVHKQAPIDTSFQILKIKHCLIIFTF